MREQGEVARREMLDGCDMCVRRHLFTQEAESWSATKQ